MIANQLRRAGFQTWIIVGSLLSCVHGQTQSRDAVLQSVDRATDFLSQITTHGGFVGIYSLDLKDRYGEGLYEKAASDEIWVQPPGTPSVGAAYLRLYHVTQNNRFLEMARRAGRALAWGQRLEGGWDHRVKVSDLSLDAERPRRVSGRCTFDDRITQGALEFLMDLDHDLNEPWLDDAIKWGLDFMLEAQFPNGAWSQWFPLRGGYHDYYTFNDRAINDCISVLLKAYRSYGNSTFLEGAKRGADFILLSQLPSPQAGWAQQYSHDLRPAAARAFEPAGVCSAATVNALRSLLEVFEASGEERFLAAFPAAEEWLEASVLKQNQISQLRYPDPEQRRRRMWARLYELETNRPIYGDREAPRKVFYDLDGVSERERTSYGWQGTYGVDAVLKSYRELQRIGSKTWRSLRSQNGNPPTRPPSAAKVAEIIEAQDEQGRWITSNQIQIATFVQNLNLLCDALAVGDQ